MIVFSVHTLPRFLAHLLQEAVRETAAAYGVEPVEVGGVAHDLMLDARWESAARALEQWLSALLSGETGRRR